MQDLSDADLARLVESSIEKPGHDDQLFEAFFALRERGEAALLLLKPLLSSKTPQLAFTGAELLAEHFPVEVRTTLQRLARDKASSFAADAQGLLNDLNART
jgi:hypothetical protein